MLLVKWVLKTSFARRDRSSRVRGGRHRRRGQHIKKVALLGVDDPLHLGQLCPTEAVVGETL